MADKNMISLRNSLAARAPVLAVDGLSPREIVAAFRKSHRKEVDACIDALLDIALVKVLDDVGRRKMRAKPKPGQHDMWAMLGFPTMLSYAHIDGTNKKKPITRVLVAEAETWLAAQSQERQRNMEDAKRMREVLRKIKPFVTRRDMTLEEAITLADKAGALGAK